MGDKIKKYILLIVVVLIWGIIVFKIVNLTNPTPPPFKTNYDSVKKLQNSRIDTFNLLLNYRDPFVYYKNFRKHESQASLSNTIVKGNPIKKLTPKQEVKWPDVLYGGIIKNNLSGKQVFLITINSKEYLMKIKDTLEGILIKEVYPDSICLSNGSSYKTFFKLNK